MKDRPGSKRELLLAVLAASLVLLVWAPGGYPAHDLGQNCYNCHNIATGQVWIGSYSIWSGASIGMSPYSRPISCDFCHTDYGNRFKATSASHHPVAVIAAASMSSSYDNGVVLQCKDCHNANSVTPALPPNLSPDLAPAHYDNTYGNDPADGYPNHDILSPNNQTASGDPPHLLSMLLSGGKRTVSGASTYNKVPSSNPAADYAFCFSCHDGGVNTGRAVNVKQDYIDKGHFFKTTGSGITAGDRIPCSDCHASHNSPTNARLLEPDNTTWTGPRPTGLTFASPYAPTNAEYRALCIFCHEDYNAGNTVNTTKRVRGVAPRPRLYGVSGHSAADTVSCRQCHNPHKTPGGGPECLGCHTSGGGGGAYDYIDNVFKGVGSDNGATQPAPAGSLNWSQHGGFVSAGGAARFLYVSPYNTKGTNDCFKCHGDRHNNTYPLIDADNTDSYAFVPSQGMHDNTPSGVANANAFCLSCHDGGGAPGDIQIGNQVPPNVAANYAVTGHGRPQASGVYAVSLNNPAYLKCIDCHEVHGSNHAKLLPAKKNETAANFTMPSNFPEKTFRSGGATLLARDIDFTDYSSPASGKGFGTAGDPGDQRPPSGATTGLCDACHRFAGRVNRGTDNVTNRAHTHEGITTDNNQDTPSQMNFSKDCLECHNTHGTTNLEMVNTSINGYAVTFTSRTGANSLDPAETGTNPNANSTCVVCHQSPSENPALNVSHNYRTSTVNPDHNEDGNCASCHPHGTSNVKKFGFAQAACNSCHGSDPTGMPSSTDGGIYHADANNVIGTRGGDNTAHRIHVSYLANRRGIAGPSTCYVCHKGGGSQETVHPANPTYMSFKTGGQPSAAPYLQVALDNGGTGSVLNVWNGVGTGPAYNGTLGAAAGVSNGWKTCSNTTCHYALSPSWSGKRQIGGTAFPSTTYIVNIDSGTSLGWGATNMTAGPGKTGPNDNTLLVLSGETTAATDYGAADTTQRTAFNAIWNTALGAGSGTTITGVTFNMYFQKANAGDRVRLLLQYFNPSGGAATTIYDTGLVDSGGPVGSPALYTHASPALAAAVPDGMKLGLKVNFQQGSASAMRVYAATGTAGQNARLTISGSSATGAAPAPPRTTGDEAAIACNSCHQFGPDDATSGYKDGNQYYYDLPGSHAKHGFSLIAGNDPAADNALNTCTLCHPAAANAYSSDHLDGLVDLRSGTIGTRTGARAYADDGTYDEATRSCANVYCHAGRPTPQSAGKSWGYGASACGQCHAVTPPYGKHGAHNAGNVSTTPSNGTTASAYDFSCYYCHPSGAAHVNYPVSAVQAADVSFSGTLGGQTLGGAYTAGGASAGWDNAAGQGLSWSNGSCATYCHSNGRGGAALVTPTWNHSGFPSATCNGCHDTGGAATTLSARHSKHTDNAAGTGYAFTCDECHAVTVANDSRTTLNSATGRVNHVDGNLTVQFGTTLRTTTQGVGGSYTLGTHECSATYCHSDGTSVKNAGTIQANTIRWDNTTSPLPCNSCHGVGGPPSGSPNYATSGTRRNSHPAHVSFGCQTCHAQTTATGNTITAADNHVNGSYQVAGTGFVYAFDNVNGSTCAFTSGCHGSGTVRWGSQIQGFCFGCHQGAEGTNKPQGASDGLANPVDNVQYLQSGHGRTGSNYPVSGNPPAGKWDAGTGGGCYSTDPAAGCHSSTAAHVPSSPSDPYRLGAAYADNTTALCLSCHGPSGPAATRNMQEHSKAITGSSKSWPGSDYAWKCVDCHDPHGDGTDASRRINMIRAAVNNPTGIDEANVGSNSKGSPKRAPGWTAISFTDNTGFAAGSYAQPGTGTWGICEGCHRNTTAFSQTLDNTSTHATRTDRCTSCHVHTGGFKASCANCHGDGASAAWPDVPAGPYPDRSGAHVRHVDAIYNANSGTLPGATATDKKNGTCNWCHPNPGGARGGTGESDHTSNAAPTGTADVHQDGRAGASATYFRKMQGAADPAGTFNTGTHACSNINCHGGSGTTPPWYGDTTPPGTIANLTASPGTDWGSVLLRWTAPGGDGATGTAHHYEVRYRTGGPVTSGTWAADNVLGGAPSPAPAGDNQTMTANGLLQDGATVYYFGIRAWDAAGNVSGVSNSPGSKAAYDNVAPIFSGIASALPADSSGTVDIAWNAALDNTMPITYRIWWSTSGSIDYGAAPNATTNGLDYRATGLTDGTAYTFAVRAADSVPTPNVDGNTVTLIATPATPAPGAANKAFYLRRSNAATIFTGLVTDIPATCGSITGAGIAFPATPVPPATTGFGDIIPGRQGLLVDNTTGACGGNANNYTYDSAGWTGGTWRWGQAFYYNTAFPNGALITGSASNTLFTYSVNATDSVRIRFAAVTGSGSYTFSTNSVTWAAATNVATLAAPNLSSLSVNVPPGGKFAIVFDWTGNSTSTNTHRVGLDGYLYLLAPVINVNLNRPPDAPSITAPSAGGSQSGTVNITWTASTDPDGSAVHYDVYGSINNGATYPFIIAKNVSGTSASWDTVADQIGMNAAATGVRIRVEAGDGYFHTAGTMGGSFTVDNRVSDGVAPGAITNLTAATLTKIGGVRLSWSAPGDDNYTGQASRYDIRYSTQAITDNARFAAATIADNTIVPKAAGSAESIEVTGLTPGTVYFFSVKTADEVPNWSAVSNSPSAAAGANCGVCHASPPNSAATRGSHDKHGSAQVDCAKCHGTAASTYTTAHSDGGLQLGFRTATPDNLAYPPSQLQVTFLQATRTIYQDNSGGGGVDWFTGSDDVDNGSCMSFNQAGVNATGCHASATPVWGNPASGACGTCHGTPGRTGYLDSTGDVDGAPPKDLAGGSTGTNVGKHLEHVNVSYYYTGDSCKLCHNGAGKGTVLHADGTLQFSFHPAAGPSAAYDNASHTCSSLAAGCHPALPWDSASNPACTVCHAGFASHTKSNRTTGACTDCHPGGARAGFTKKHSLNGGTSGIVLIPRPPSSWGDPSGRLAGTNMQAKLGIDYGSMGGIHLGGDLTSGATEAEICWNCHRDVDGANTFGISEWGFNTKTTPSGFPVVLNTAPGNFPTQHDGTADRVNGGWLWNSGYTAKTADWTAGYWWNEYDSTIRYRVASLHTASFDPAGQSSSVANNVQGAGTINRTTPVLEDKAYIRCAYCHDVHDLNKAQGDASSGKPFLRGTWVGNPYPPELPPRTAYYSAGGYTTRVNTIGANTPRGLSTAQNRGGYFIDQNSGWPTDSASMNSLALTAGLCTLCHGTNVDSMKFYTGSTLWRTGMYNGHSNSTLGGTGANKRDLFTAARYGYGMGMQLQVPYTPYVCGSTGGACDGNYPQARDCCDCSSDCYNLVNSGWFGGTAPLTGSGTRGGGDFNNWYGIGTIGGAWGPNTMAHKFTCSKCHSPHAAGLPALLTHNCIDTALAQAAPFAPANLIAQNCHRKTATTDGWHKLAPLAPGQ